MDSVMDFMGKDHDRLDEIFRRFAELNPENKLKQKHLFHDFNIGLKRHIVWEEEILFPIFESKTGMLDSSPTYVMRLEHKEIKDYLERIHNAFAKNNAKGINLLEQGILSVLTEHNEKEESVLYPWIDDSLDEKEIKEVLSKMEKLPPEKYGKCCE